VSEPQSRPRRAIPHAAWLRGAAVLLGAAACVEITTSEGGVQSVSLGYVPPSIVAGDTLRDTLGLPLALRALAFTAGGDTVSGATFTYGFLPIGTDTGAARSALTVDSSTGAVRAATLPGVAQARLTARFGGRLQIVDTVAIVRPPTRLRRVTPADTVLTLQYFCNDAGTRLETASTDAVGNATRALGVRVLGDSAGDSVAVPSYLVRYRITTVDPSKRIPVGLSPFGDERPAIYMTRPPRDRPIGSDTTNSTGVTAAQLRVLPSLLPRSSTDSVLTVNVVARVLSRRQLLPDSVAFRVSVVRRSPPSGAACP
jgi:hypothetical protein